MSNKLVKNKDQKKGAGAPGTAPSAVDMATAFIINSPKLYTILSFATRMPFVICNGETFDDEIVVFVNEDVAKKHAQFLVDQKYVVQIRELTKEERLPFFANLFYQGVNAVCVCADKEYTVQLSDMVKRNFKDDDENNAAKVENPEFVLTSCYLLQESRRPGGVPEEKEEQISELQEEMIVHFKEGTFFVPVSTKEEIPLVTNPNGDNYQPVFTDLPELQKFIRENKGVEFKYAVVPAGDFNKALAEEAKGVAVNVCSVNIQLNISKNQE